MWLEYVVLAVLSQETVTQCLSTEQKAEGHMNCRIRTARGQSGSSTPTILFPLPGLLQDSTVAAEAVEVAQPL